MIRSASLECVAGSLAANMGLGAPGAGVRCACAVADDLGAFSEAADDYGVGDEPLAPFAHNLISSAAALAACGRLYAAHGVEGAAVHVAGEATACAAAAAAAAAALAGVYVGRGDEGDHRWAPFSVPLIVGEAPFAAAEAAGPLDAAALRAACGGALQPELGFEARAADDASLVEFDAAAAAAGDVDAQRNMDDAIAWLAAVHELGARLGRITYLRPLEGRDTRGCVFPHFLVGVTQAGSLAGVFGLTVWT